MRVPFSDLPRQARDAVNDHVGGVRGFCPAMRGNHAAFAGTVRGAAGEVFVKGSPLSDTRESAFMHREAATLAHVWPLGPTLLWHVEAGGWLLIGMEHIRGYHPEYTPGSPDLEAVAAAVGKCSELRCPDTVKPYADRFAKIGQDASVLAGDALIHADLNPFNVLIHDGAARVVDWAFASRGAPWLEGALLLPWLMQNGHTPAHAEDWAAERIPGFAEVGPAHLDRFTDLLSALWRDYLPTVWAHRYAATVRAWHTLRHGPARAPAG